MESRLLLLLLAAGLASMTTAAIVSLIFMKEITRSAYSLSSYPPHNYYCGLWVFDFVQYKNVLRWIKIIRHVWIQTILRYNGSEGCTGMGCGCGDGGENVSLRKVVNVFLRNLFIIFEWMALCVILSAPIFLAFLILFRLFVRSFVLFYFVFVFVFVIFLYFEEKKLIIHIYTTHTHWEKNNKKRAESEWKHERETERKNGIVNYAHLSFNTSVLKKIFAFGKTL